VKLDPKTLPGLGARTAKADTASLLVVVADEGVVHTPDPSPRPIGPEQRQAMLGRQEPVHGFDLLGARRLGLFPLFTRKLDGGIAGRVGLTRSWSSTIATAVLVLRIGSRDFPAA
jgi:hypothetical protein